MKKTILGLSCALALVASLAQAQTTTTTQSTTATTAGGVTSTTTTTDTSMGTITDFTPGTSVILKTEAASPVTYKFGKTVTYVDESGKVVESSTIRKDSKVRVHYVKQGSDMMVDKVIVVK